MKIFQNQKHKIKSSTRKQCMNQTEAKFYPPHLFLQIFSKILWKVSPWITLYISVQMNLFVVSRYLANGRQSLHAHFPFSLLQFFCSPPIPTTTTLTSCFLAGLPATKRPKNKSAGLFLNTVLSPLFRHQLFIRSSQFGC